ncbi:MAG: Nif3-like dinuclear metal center hexameric protein [Desulfocapsaceae bacterium]
MTVTISDIITCLDAIAPFGMAQSWDNVGLLIGDRRREVKSILVGLDPTNRLLKEALDKGADTVITHHPAIFKPFPSIDTAEPSGSFLETALVSRLNILACHTNFDSAVGGVNDALAELLGLAELSALVPAEANGTEGAGLGRVGRYPEARSGQEFIELLLDILELSSVQVAGVIPERIETVALCGGSGSEFAETARQRGADVYISAEIKHNIGCWAEEAGFCVIDGTHYATEKPAVKLLTEHLVSYAQTQGWDLTIFESTSEKHPFSTVTRQ